MEARTVTTEVDEELGVDEEEEEEEGGGGGEEHDAEASAPSTTTSSRGLSETRSDRNEGEVPLPRLPLLLRLRGGGDEYEEWNDASP